MRMRFRNSRVHFIEHLMYPPQALKWKGQMAFA